MYSCNKSVFRKYLPQEVVVVQYLRQILYMEELRHQGLYEGSIITKKNRKLNLEVWHLCLRKKSTQELGSVTWPVKLTGTVLWGTTEGSVGVLSQLWIVADPLLFVCHTAVTPPY